MVLIIPPPLRGRGRALEPRDYIENPTVRPNTGPFPARLEKYGSFLRMLGL